MLLANLSTPLLGLVDTSILGHLNSPIYLGAVALGAQLVALLFWSFGFLRMGTTGSTSRCFGAADKDELKAILIRGVCFGTFIGLAILVTQSFYLPSLIELITKDPVINPLALAYSEIRIWSAPATLITYVLLGWLIGIQKTSFAMAAIVSLNLLNIALDYLFVVELDLRSDGAAWATLISEYVGCVVAGALSLRAAKHLGISFDRRPVFDWQAYLVLFRSSQHLFVRTLCLLFCFLYFSVQSAEFGENTLAANAILLNLLAITAYAMDGFAYAAETLGGEAWGAKNKFRFQQVAIYTWGWAIGVALLSSAIMIAGEPWIFNIYTDIPIVQSELGHYFLWLALLPLVAVHSYQLDGIFLGAGETLAMRNAMLASCFLVFFPLWFALESLGNLGLWITLWVFHIARSGFLFPRFCKIFRCHFT